jgi:hypothetical protein
LFLFVRFFIYTVVRILKYFKNWSSLLEATLDTEKKKSDIAYVPSTAGRKQLSKLGLSEELTFEPSDILPESGEQILWIRASKFEIISFRDLKKTLGIRDRDCFIFDTTSKTFPKAVAHFGVKTTMVLQKDRKRGSARGDYYRETAFAITLAKKVYETYNHKKFELRTKRGPIRMQVTESGNYLPSVRNFRDKYENFMDSKIGKAMEIQCDELLKAIGAEAVKKITIIQKNTVDLTINKFFKEALAKEREKAKAGASNFILPEKIAIAKWNPSDLWIGFGDKDWMLSTRIEKVEDYFEDEQIWGLPELNEFLGDSIKNKHNVIGVSIKQQVWGAGKIYAINLDRSKRAKHKYKGHRAKSTYKNVMLSFAFSFEDLGKMLSSGEGQIEVRTPDTKTNSPISLEVTGSKTSEHKSGRAGSYIKFVMKDDYDLLNYIQKFSTTDGNCEELAEYFKSKYNFKNPDLEKIFYDDCKLPKTAYSNSRMQAVYFVDWLEKQDEKECDEIISQIIRFAKSESDWSAPHYVVK